MRTKTTPALDVAAVEKILGVSFKHTAQRCHEVSLAVVKAGILPGPARVARGTCVGVGGQHSWIVAGTDCYAPDAEIYDPTLWSYDSSVTGVWHGSARDGRHFPYGAGDIFAYGKPISGGGPIIDLTPTVPLSGEAELFLDLLGPLDRAGWSTLAHAPVGGWPAAEIIAAMADTPGLKVIIPIDILGMLTDRNPNGLYLP